MISNLPSDCRDAAVMNKSKQDNCNNNTVGVEFLARTLTKINFLPVQYGSVSVKLCIPSVNSNTNSKNVSCTVSLLVECQSAKKFE